MSDDNIFPNKPIWKWDKDDWSEAFYAIIGFLILGAMLYGAYLVYDAYKNNQTKCQSGVVAKCDSRFVKSSAIFTIAEKELNKNKISQAKKLFKRLCSRDNNGYCRLRRLVRSSCPKETIKGCLALSLIEVSLGNTKAARKILNRLCERENEDACKFLQVMSTRDN